MSISEHINGLDPNTDFKCNRGKQDKRLSNHPLPLHILQKTKHNSSDPRYAALKWYSINFQWVFSMELIGVGWGGINEALGDVESTLEGIR